MKTIILTTVLLLIFPPVFGQNTRQDKKAERKALKTTLQMEIKTVVENKNFKIKVNRAIPLRGGSISLTSPYDIAVHEDVATAYLPYFGVSHQAEYGSSEGGIKFSEPMLHYTTKFNKRKGYIISFEVKTQKNYYGITINVGMAGYATVDINSLYSDSINYSGELIFEESKSTE